MDDEEDSRASVSCSGWPDVSSLSNVCLENKVNSIEKKVESLELKLDKVLKILEQINNSNIKTKNVDFKI